MPCSQFRQKGHSHLSVLQVLSQQLRYTWASDPSQNLPMHLLPEHGSRQLFQQALQLAEFETCARQTAVGLSLVAKMILKPHTLPAAVLKLFGPKLQWIHQASSQGEGLREDLFVVAQEGNSQWPPYCLRWHYRPLPNQIKEALVTAMAQKETPVLSEATYPRVTEGVSEESLRHNVGVLFALSRSGVGGHQAMVASIILAWLSAFGFGTEDIAKCLKADLRGQWPQKLKVLCNQITPHLRKQCTLGPLPTYVDVKWVDASQQVPSLFKLSKTSAQFTAQWLNNIVNHAELEIDSFEADDLVRPVGPSESDVQAGSRCTSALSEVARAWGCKVADRLARKDERLITWKAGQPPQADTGGLTSFLSLFADFNRILRS